MTIGPPRATVPAVSVIVATHNRAALVGDTIRALLGQIVPPRLTWEILVVDNGSTDGTRDVIASFARGPVPVRYLSEPARGKSRAVNAGLRVARAPVVALTDDDVLPASDWVAVASRILDEAKADGAGGKVLPRWEAPAPDWVTQSPRLLHLLGLMEHDRRATLSLPIPFEPQVWGPNMVFRRSVLETVGGLDERRGPVGGRRFSDEDTEIVRRLLAEGHRVVYDPSLIVHHRVPATRLRRGYFRRVQWDSGVGAVVEHGDRALLGTPRWRYRRFAGALGSWTRRRLMGDADAFDDELELIESVGAIWGGLARPR